MVSSLSLTKFPFSSKSQPIPKWPDVLIRNRLAHTTLGQASMEGLEQENRLLKEEMATMQAKMNEMAATQTQVDELTELVRTLRAAQNQPPPPPPPVRTQAEASGSAIPDWTICSESPTFSAPPRYAPWFPPFTYGEIFHPIACEPPMPTFQPTGYSPLPVPTHHQSKYQVPTIQHTIYVPPPVATRPQAAMTYSAPAIHTVRQNEESIFRPGNMGAYDRVHNLQEKYDEMYREI